MGACCDTQMVYASVVFWKHRYRLYLSNGARLLKMTDDAALLLNLLFKQSFGPAALLQISDFLQQHVLGCAMLTSVFAVQHEA